MSTLKQPTKGKIREWMQQRQVDRKELPDMEQIRRELGWKLIRSVRAEM